MAAQDNQCQIQVPSNADNNPKAVNMASKIGHHQMLIKRLFIVPPDFEHASAPVP